MRLLGRLSLSIYVETAWLLKPRAQSLQPLGRSLLCFYLVEWKSHLDTEEFSNCLPEIFR
jgi:hypothetical protein